MTRKYWFDWARWLLCCAHILVPLQNKYNWQQISTNAPHTVVPIKSNDTEVAYKTFIEVPERSRHCISVCSPCFVRGRINGGDESKICAHRIVSSERTHVQGVYINGVCHEIYRSTHPGNSELHLWTKLFRHSQRMRESEYSNSCYKIKMRRAILATLCHPRQVSVYSLLRKGCEEHGKCTAGILHVEHRSVRCKWVCVDWHISQSFQTGVIFCSAPQFLTGNLASFIVNNGSLCRESVYLRMAL